ncbi:hypothetical protein HNP46_000184 [Pseudomonas nitritireducens]|uniref:DUF1064 domain-containing protein n=1 Tax=Pseudomonas nitroreducens TaxID=46680 RepID=A0A7W7KFK6_PSENT|nr:DUF1064 domain-containing protein [Pseudomonas nitritireducens]MBB4861373.1 hypothetical protein [Pseudomonas nitritireducens]
MTAVSFRNVKLDASVTRISAADFRQVLAAAGPEEKKGKGGKGKSKFKAEPVNAPEGYFDSKGEYKRFLDLQLLERAGVISDLRRQVRYPLQIGDCLVSTYIADFVYTEKGREVVEDFKGFRTREYLQKKRLMKDIHGIEIYETGTKSSSKVKTRSPSARKAAKGNSSG